MTTKDDYKAKLPVLQFPGPGRPWATSWRPSLHLGYPISGVTDATPEPQEAHPVRH